MVKRIALLGATGSIGSSTLDVISEHPDSFQLVLATANSNRQKLEELGRKFSIPDLVLTGAESGSDLFSLPMGRAHSLKPTETISSGTSRLHHGAEELYALLKAGDYDIAINAISGSAGLVSSIEILSTGKDLALANKESLVMAGHLVKEITARTGAKIIPIDSEHSALFQAIGTTPNHEIRKVHITASGGAFRTLPLDQFSRITKEQALKHPNWDMGAKVTIDSATMFNKALEVIEAHYLFDLDYERISALIHPESVIHSLVEFIDGSILAQLSFPDMRIPILYAFSFPQRLPSNLVKTDLFHHSPLHFEPVGKDRYPLFWLGLEVANQGGIMPTVMNAANEAALRLFLEERISFSQIPVKVEQTLSRFSNILHPSLDEIIKINQEAFQKTLSG